MILPITIGNKLKNLTIGAGIYQMLDKDNKIIYIGKAKNLNKRISSYFNGTAKDNKTMSLVAKIVDFQVIVVATEVDALLLENELIKQHKPYYNILLKDAKSYPYIVMSNDKYPQINFYRGTKNKKYRYFGPYTNASVVRSSLTMLKKIFRLRTCANSVYQSRSRACLDYQIKLCSAPCVNKISADDYHKDVANAILFLQGSYSNILLNIKKKMQDAAQKLDFEGAVYYREQMIKLRLLQDRRRNYSNIDMDIIFSVNKDAINCIQILFIRNSKQVGSECLFMKNPIQEDIVSVFLSLYYIGKDSPQQVVINYNIKHKASLEKAINSKIITKLSQEKKYFMQIAKLTANENLRQFLNNSSYKKLQLSVLQKILSLKSSPNYIECFDISHNLGENTVASCVRFEYGMPAKKYYRQFIINNAKAGDDCGAMAEAIFRRYKTYKNLPDILFVDGGLGQLNIVIDVFNSLGIDSCLLVGVAKGEKRKYGLETLILKIDNIVKKIKLKKDNKALALVNHVRDEAHRFAIKNHRIKYAKKRNSSVLENISGIGKNKSKQLINYFGGLNEIKKVNINELAKVSGVSIKIATKIFNFFNTKK